MAFLKLFDLSSTGLEITIILNFFENFPEFLKKKTNTVYNSQNIEDFRKVQRQSYCKIAKVSLKPFSSEK